MDFGLIMFPTGYAIQPNVLAKEAELRGFESLWFPEHTHIPASRESAWPGGPDLPKEYWSTYDPFVALSFAAQATSTIKLGTGICLVIERDPITLAKEISSIDQLSQGRFMLGIGGGWNAEEMANHGTDFKTRFGRLRETILAMKTIWNNDSAEFHGQYVDFDAIWSFPKPLQKPNPPILMGGDGRSTFDRVTEFCDGWMPIWGRTTNSVNGNNLEEKIENLRSKWTNSERGDSDLDITLFGVPPEGEAVEKALSMGANRVIFATPCAEESVVIPHLDKCAQFIKGY